MPHQIRLRRTRQDVLIAGDEQGGHVDGLQVGHRIRPLGHALLYLGDAFGRHFAHYAQRTIHQVGTTLTGGLAQQFGNHAFEKRRRSALQYLSGGLQTAGLGLGRIRRRFRVEQGQGSDSSTVSAPELEQHIASDGSSGKGSSSHFGVIEDASKVRGMLLHAGRAFAHAGVAVAAQIGKNHLITESQSLGCWEPQFMMGRERMEQHDRWARSQDLVSNRGVATLDLNHRGDSDTKKILGRKELKKYLFGRCPCDRRRAGFPSTPPAVGLSSIRLSTCAWLGSRLRLRPFSVLPA